MIITLSPAKLQDFDTPLTVTDTTIPLFNKEAGELYSSISNLNVDQIVQLMNINRQLASDVHQYIHAFGKPNNAQRQAIFAYNGIAYKGLDARTLSTEALEWAQKHLIHLSGLYGALRPLDQIEPYRMEMQVELANNKGKNLYQYWSKTLSQYIARRMEEDDNTWINLSSNEYTKAIDKKLLPQGARIITPLFKQDNGKGYKQIVVYAKKARGMMARFIIENKLTDVEHIKAFDTEGYCFAPQLSTPKEWVFIR